MLTKKHNHSKLEIDNKWAFIYIYYYYYYFSEGLSGVSQYYWVEFPVSLSNHVGTTPRLLIYPLGTVTHQ